MWTKDQKQEDSGEDIDVFRIRTGKSYPGRLDKDRFANPHLVLDSRAHHLPCFGIVQQE